MTSLRLLWWVVFASTALAANPVPLVYQPLSPTYARPGGPSFTLIVRGTGFVPGSVVQWNGMSKSSRFINRSVLMAKIPASDIAAAQTASISVVSPPPGGGVSNQAYFQITDHSVSLRVTDTTISCPTSTCNAAATADLNHDGILDMVVTEIPTYGDPSLEILLGNGDGSFRLNGSYYAGISPTGAALGDFNHDGNPDLAVVSQLSGVLVLLGNGDGTFQPAVQYQAGQTPFDLVTADFNRDGKLDLAVVNEGSNDVSILLGNGDGTFQPAVPYNTLGSPVGLITGDFDSDGKLDLAVISNTTEGGISILLGNGDGTFQQYRQLTTGNFLAIMPADFNQDGKLDLAATYVSLNGPGGVDVILGNGNGTFQNPVSYPAGEAPVSIVSGDFDADGKLDLVLANGYFPPGGAYLLLGEEDGVFQPSINLPLNFLSHSIVAGDFNQDGKLDVAIGNSCLYSCVVSLLLQ